MEHMLQKARENLYVLHRRASRYKLIHIATVLIILLICYVLFFLQMVMLMFGYTIKADPWIAQQLMEDGFFFLLLIPPMAFFEEVLFRVPLLLVFKVRLRDTLAFAWVGSLVVAFALSHLGNFSSTPFLYIFSHYIVASVLYSLFFMHVYVRTKDVVHALLATWMCHMSYNFSIFILSML